VLSGVGRDRPRQAVILAGGLGTRLGELGRRVPKPLVPAAGVPFLAYLLRLLRAQGFERVVMLLGYRAEMIRDWCGDGSRHGVSIEYSIGAVEDGTGQRLRRAASLLDPTFLLLYCDNYWPLPFERMWRHVTERPRAAAQVTVYRNRDRYTRDNMIVSQDGFVTTYDKSRTQPDLAGVDIGFVILERDVIDRLSHRTDASFEAEIYPALAAEGRLAAFETDHRYYSVGTPERLTECERFLSRRPCVIVDRDGVLNVKAERGCYVTSPTDWRWLPGARESLREISEAGADVIVVSNQAGIARGALQESDLAAIHARMHQEAAAVGGRILDVLVCPHHWDDGCECRKPRPGMLLEAQRRHDLDLSLTPFVGDDPRDGEAAAAVDQPFYPVDPEIGLVQALPGVLEHLRAHGQGQKPHGA
jgi:histidinol-phosphate phosphatase family protein